MSQNPAPLPIQSLITESYRDSFQVWRYLPLHCLIALLLTLIATALDGETIGDTDFKNVPLDFLLQLAVIPFEIAFIRGLMLGDTSTSYLGEFATQRYRIYAFWTSLLAITGTVVALPAVSSAIYQALGVSETPERPTLLFGLVFFAEFLLSMRLFVLGPWIAITGEAHPVAAWVEMTGRFWQVVVCTLAVVLPPLLVVGAIAFVAGPMVDSESQGLIAKILLALCAFQTRALLVALSAHIAMQVSVPGGTPTPTAS